MENKDLIIIALIAIIIYQYYRNSKQKTLFHSFSDPEKAQEISETIANLKEENEDLIADKDEAIRKKNEAEQEVLDKNNKLKLKQQEVNRKDQQITRLKEEKSKVEIALNNKITELKTKYSEREKLLDEEQCENNKLTGKIEKLEEEKKELETEKNNLLTEINKHDDLDDFQTWLNKDEKNKANLPDWDKIISEMKNKIADYHLQEGNWASGLFKRNGNYWTVFKDWLDSDYD